MTAWWDKIKGLLEPEAVAIYDELIKAIPTTAQDAAEAAQIATNEAIQLSQAISLRRLCQAWFGDFT